MYENPLHKQSQQAECIGLKEFLALFSDMLDECSRHIGNGETIMAHALHVCAALATERLNNHILKGDVSLEEIGYTSRKCTEWPIMYSHDAGKRKENEKLISSLELGADSLFFESQDSRWTLQAGANLPVKNLLLHILKLRALRTLGHQFSNQAEINASKLPWLTKENFVAWFAALWYLTLDYTSGHPESPDTPPNAYIGTTLHHLGGRRRETATLPNLTENTAPLYDIKMAPSRRIYKIRQMFWRAMVTIARVGMRGDFDGSKVPTLKDMKRALAEELLNAR